MVLAEGERAHIAAAATPRLRTWRRGIAIAKLRAGKVLSDETVRCLRSALDDHEEAMVSHRSAMRQHKKAAGQIQDLMDRAGVPGDEPDAKATDGDAKDVQKSGGTAEDEGARSADFRRRQAEALALGAP